MDRKEDWAWLPRLMPTVAKMMSEYRLRWGAAHVAQCWRHGMAGEPGWFFAREGAIAVGTPWDEYPEMVALAALRVQAHAPALLFLRPPAGLTAGAIPVITAPAGVQHAAR